MKGSPREMEMFTICCVLLPVLIYKSLIQGENLRNIKCDLLTITQNISGTTMWEFRVRVEPLR